MHAAFDPRPWNLVAGLAGLALVSGACGSRTIAGDTQGTGDASTDDASTDDATTDDASTDDTSTASTETGPECMTSADCPPGGYYCLGGYCEYEGYVDGHQWYECYSDPECGPLALCMYNYCNPVEVPAACDPNTPDLGIPLSFEGAALGLAFTDVDADGDAELVVITNTQLHVFATGVDTPTTSPRVINSRAVAAAASGQFDASPGEDLVIAAGAELTYHNSDGVSGFAVADSYSSMVGLTTGLRAGDFDGQAGTDLLVFGDEGALLNHGGGDLTPLSMQATSAAAIREQGLAGAGVMLHQPNGLEFFDLAGTSLGIEQYAESSGPTTPAPVAAYMVSDTPFNISTSWISNWALFEQWGPAGGKQLEWGLEFEPAQIVVGDFDGDSNDELVLLDTAGGVWLHRLDLGVGCVRPIALDGDAIASELAIGDHDGDGDDELAARLADGGAVIISVGG